MRRDHAQIEAPSFGRTGDVVVFGHYGRPVLVFPSPGGRAWEFEENGMLDGVRSLIESGAAKIYCADGFGAEAVSATTDSRAEVAPRQAAYESWVLDYVVPFVYADCSGPIEMVVAGAGGGAVQAASFALRRADLFPTAICLSGRYDLPADELAAGETGVSPVDHVAQLEDDELAWLRDRLNLVLVSGRGRREVELGTLKATRRLADLLAARGVRHELDVWGEDADHDWPSWAAQLSRHLPRFCG